MIPMWTTAVPLMMAAYAAGILLAALAPSSRAARWITAATAAGGALAGLDVSAAVLTSGAAVHDRWPTILAAAGGIAIDLDPLGAVFLALVSAVVLAAAIFGATETAALEGRRSLRAFGAMFNAFALGMSVVPCAGNVFTFLIAWELMALASYFLVMTDSDDPEVRQAGLWYIGMTHAGFILLLPMFLILAPSPDATSFADLRSGAAALSPAARNGVFLLALGGFGSKAGIVPFHVWLPRAHPAAPSHVSALMSGVMLKLGIYGLLRVVLDVLGGGPAWWGALVLVFGSLSALGGVLYALTDNDLKRLLAYSSVENVGVILLGIGAGLVLDSYGLRALALAGFAAALLHTVNHAVFKSVLFLAAGSVVHATGTRSMERMGGLIKRMPQSALAFLIGSAAAAALPPLNGFASEWLVFQALLSGTQIPQPEVAVAAPLAIGVLALTGGLAAVTFVKAFGITFLALPRSDEADSAHDSHWSARAVTLTLAAACVVLGLEAPRLVFGITAVLDGVSRTHAAATHTSPLWLGTPAGIARVSPAIIAAALVAVGAIAVGAVRFAGLRVRGADTWGCGRIRHTARMEYTSAAFAEPLRRIFSELYRPTEDLSVSVHPESRYFVRSITYTARVVPWIEASLYEPILAAARRTAAAVRRLQAGSVHLYLLYVATALFAALAATWWLQ